MAVHIGLQSLQPHEARLDWNSRYHTVLTSMEQTEQSTVGKLRPFLCIEQVVRTLLARLKEQANARFAVTALEEPAYGAPSFKPHCAYQTSRGPSFQRQLAGGSTVICIS